VHIAIEHFKSVFGHGLSPTLFQPFQSFQLFKPSD